MTFNVERIAFSEELFAPMLSEAPEHGGLFLLRLRHEWIGGALRFDGDGELLLGVVLNGRLLGVGGISHDPYDPAPGLGRIRHLYVLKDYRGRGIGRSILNRLLDHGKQHFSALRLSTDAPKAARFYESSGFKAVEGHKQSHRLDF